MSISVQSAKAKGRNLQKWTRDLILGLFPSLEPDDVKSTGMGQSGEDIQLSPAARKKIPYSIEAKSRNKMVVYSMYEQAEANSGKHQPLVVLKADRKKPLVLVDAEHFFKLLKDRNENS